MTKQHARGAIYPIGSGIDQSFIAMKPTYLPDVNAVIGESASSIVNGAVKGMYAGGIKDGKDEIVTNQEKLGNWVAEAVNKSEAWEVISKNIAGMALNTLQMEKGMIAGGVGKVGGDIIGSEIGNTIDASQQTIINQPVPTPLPNISFARQITRDDHRGAI